MQKGFCCLGVCSSRPHPSPVDGNLEGPSRCRPVTVPVVRAAWPGVLALLETLALRLSYPSFELDAVAGVTTSKLPDPEHLQERTEAWVLFVASEKQPWPLCICEPIKTTCLEIKTGLVPVETAIFSNSNLLDYYLPYAANSQV